MFSIKLGVPEMKELWDKLTENANSDKPNKRKLGLYNKLGRALTHLSADTHYPSLQTHEIDELTSRYGMKVFESYLENNKPAAARIFWVYGPNKSDITIIGLEPHPNDKSVAYKKITLSSTDNS